MAAAVCSLAAAPRSRATLQYSTHSAVSSHTLQPHVMRHMHRPTPALLPSWVCTSPVQVATQVVASLLALDSLDPEQEIKLYINCPQARATLVGASLPQAARRGLHRMCSRRLGGLAARF